MSTFFAVIIFFVVFGAAVKFVPFVVRRARENFREADDIRKRRAKIQEELDKLHSLNSRPG